MEDGKDLGNSALELAVESGAKKFIGRPAVQQLINALYTGQVIYRPTSSRSIIEDNYKSGTSIEAFDMYSRPLLDHYILKVPRVRRAIEFSSLAVLVVLFMVLQRSTYGRTDEQASQSPLNILQHKYAEWLRALCSCHSPRHRRDGNHGKALHPLQLFLHSGRAGCTEGARAWPVLLSVLEHARHGIHV